MVKFVIKHWVWQSKFKKHLRALLNEQSLNALEATLKVYLAFDVETSINQDLLFLQTLKSHIWTDLCP